MQHDISEPVLYSDLLYKLKIVVEKPSFSDQFKKVVKFYKRVGYYTNIMQQSGCLAVNPITIFIAIVSSLFARRRVRPQHQ